MWFKQSNPNQNSLNSLEYEKLVNRITEINSSVLLLKTTVAVLETNLSSIRGFVNRKLGGAKEEEKKIETIINDEYFHICFNRA